MHCKKKKKKKKLQRLTGTCHQFQAFQGFPLNFSISSLNVSQQLVRQVVHSLPGDINLVHFTCGKGKLCENMKKSTNIFPKIIWKFFFVFASFKMHQNFKNDQFLVGKSETFS